MVHKYVLFVKLMSLCQVTDSFSFVPSRPQLQQFLTTITTSTTRTSTSIGGNHQHLVGGAKQLYSQQNRNDGANANDESMNDASTAKPKTKSKYILGRNFTSDILEEESDLYWNTFQPQTHAHIDKVHLDQTNKANDVEDDDEEEADASFNLTGSYHLGLGKKYTN